MANYVKFQRGSQEAYDALKAAGTLDNNTLYFIYNEANNTVDEQHVLDQLHDIKQSGISKERVLELIEKVFKKEENQYDRN